MFHEVSEQQGSIGEVLRNFDTGNLCERSRTLAKLKKTLRRHFEMYDPIMATESRKQRDTQGESTVARRSAEKIRRVNFDRSELKEHGGMTF